MSNNWNIQPVITGGYNDALAILDVAYGGREKNPFQKEARDNKIIMQHDADAAARISCPRRSG